MPSLEKTKFPNSNFIDSLLPQIEEWEGINLIPGETVSFPTLEAKSGFEFINATALEIPKDHEDIPLGVKEEVLDFPRALMNIRVTTKIPEEKLKDELKNYLHYGMTVLSYDVVKLDDNWRELKVTIAFETWIVETKVLTSPFIDLSWNDRMNQIISEGVCYSNYKVPNDLRDSLRRNIDKLARETNIDYHPNSKDIVRDLVHPALYSYVKGVSRMKEGFDENKKSSPTNIANEGSAENDSDKSKESAAKKAKKETSDSSKEFDFWGRPYEDSKFQWLPSPIYISSEGKCSIQEYINNLDKSKFPELYTDLGRLFEVFLPYFEEVWAYAKVMEFWRGEEDDEDYEEEKAFKFVKPDIKFRDKELQVIVKIVDYTLQPDQTYEGVWHAEGMSHENIVMTGIYFIDRDENLSGGDLRFKRAFQIDERRFFFFGVPQDRPCCVNSFAEEGYIPLGHFPTEEGYILVFPNCHIHKIAKFINQSATKAASRRIVVFFFINPEKKIISTREVAPQQNRISLQDAERYRLELMAERKYDKEKLNVRDLELCEH